MNINREIIRTYRIDQYEQDEFLKYRKKIDFDYFYSIDVPNSEWIKFNVKTNSFSGNTNCFILSKYHIECTQLAIAMSDLSSIILITKFINPSILQSTKWIQINFHSRDEYSQEFLEEHLESLFPYFANLKSINFNIFDNYESLRRMMNWKLSYPISINYNSIGI